MSVDSELFGSVGLRFVSEVFSDGEYSLSRVDYRGRKLIAEVSPVSGVYQHRWPSVEGLIAPVSARDLPGERKLLLFDIGDRIFLSETVEELGRISIEQAVKLTGMVVTIVSSLQAAGMICGYVGPEMFVSSGYSVAMIAGRRGVPDSPFTAPEVQSSRPSDPRSDVSAIGSFLFRLVAGSDDRERQLHVWRRLEPAVQAAIQDMVEVSPVNRPNGLKELQAVLDSIVSPVSEKEKPDVDEPGFARPVKKSNSSLHRKKLLWIAGSAAVLILALLAFFSSGPPSDTDTAVTCVPEDTLVAVTEEEVSPWADTVSIQEAAVSDSVVPVEDSARVWVSNCSGTPGVETELRAGSLKDYSWVYVLTGTTVRDTSLVLARRADPFTSLQETPLGLAVSRIADTSFAVRPVDLTIMLGTDLNYAGINSGFLHEPVAPAGTLFVDVVNHGIQFSLEGLGAATWAATRIDGKSCDIQGVEWLVSISDIRDADRFSEEIGIPELLEETLFLYRETNAPAGFLETALRQYYQPLPSSSEFPVESIPIPDIHILVGRYYSH
jgi:hypothetical protein